MAKQLNNPNNGRIALIQNYNFFENTVTFIEYESSKLKDFNCFKRAGYVSIDESFNNLLSQNINVSEYCYNKIKEKALNDYVLSDDVKNWLIPNKNYRLFIKNNIVVDALCKSNSLYDKIMYEIENNKNLPINQKYVFSDIEHEYVCIYYNSIDETEEVFPFILNLINSNFVIIESKNDDFQININNMQL